MPVRINDVDELYLYEQIDIYKKVGGNFEDIPNYIISNLNDKKPLRYYQQDCFKYTFHYMNNMLNNNQPHLLFHMATGSGKTLIMAGMILYYYKLGYRNFVFFVNSNNIVSKTKDNFLNEGHNKYLFNDKIIIDNKIIKINEVSDFVSFDDESINIKFTTIQQLQMDLTLIKENQITLQDFKNNKTVLIADEAHHMNAETKSEKKSKKDNLDIKSWESTINDVMNENKKNVLLEFTATADFKDLKIVQKYISKVVFSYDLLKFRADKFTKDFKNYSSEFDEMHRLLMAMLMSQYRLKLFSKNKIFAKPVVLAKLKNTIQKSNFIKLFNEFIQNEINEEDIDLLRRVSEGDGSKMFDFFNVNGISDKDLISELKIEFSSNNCISLDSKETVQNLDKKNKIVNNLEAIDNPIRLIFVVEMLHEGWDVLNLFDIVRLYDTRDAKSNKPGKATMNEAQLIGRGVRYFPFKLNDDDISFNRKYDDDIENEMKVCETLYFHSKDNSRYISDLRNALKQIGMDFEEKTKFVYKVKSQFKFTNTFKDGYIFINDRYTVNNESDKMPDSFRFVHVQKFTHNVKINDLVTEASIDNKVEETKIITTSIGELSINHFPVVYKAIRKYPIFRFNNLHMYFPNLKSINEFITSSDYISEFTMQIIITNEKPTLKEYLITLEDFFFELSLKLSTWIETYRGTKKFKPVLLKNIVKDKVREVANPSDFGEGISQNANNIPQEYKLNLSDKEWYVYNDNYGTTEEKRFVVYFSFVVEKLRNKYDEVYLIRNERNWHYYSFDDGRRFEPDYILLLKKNKSDSIFEQQEIFIEPKGTVYLKPDYWKEKFMLDLESHGKAIAYHDDKCEYKILGLPFYNHEERIKDFEEAFDKIC